MLADLIADRARTHPDRSAVIQNDVAISYATVARAIAAARRHFAASSLPSNGLAIVRTALLVDSWCTVIALRSLGIDTICVPSLAAIAALDLKDMICIVTGSNEGEREDLNAPAVAGKQIIPLPADLWTGDSAVEPGEPQGARPPVGSHILYTSGSTGTHKKVLIDAEIETRRLVRNTALLAFPPDPVVHCSFGLWTSVGFNYPPVVWHAAGCVIFDQAPDSHARFLKYEITGGFLAPAQAALLAAMPGGPQPTPRDVEIRIVGGALSLELVQGLQRKVARTIVTTYSASECQMVMGTPYRSPEDIHWYRPEPDRTVEVAGEDGRLRADGEEGELRVRLLDADCSSYLDDPEATARFFRDGCFYSGDLAVRRADGRVRILGRVADVLNVGGSKLPVAPLEEKVQQILDVSGVCLFGRINDAGHNELTVAYEAPSPVPKDRMERVAGEFTTFSQIRLVRFDRFPRASEGLQKINRVELRRATFNRAKPL